MTVVQLIEMRIGGVGAISVMTAFQNLAQMPLTGTDEMFAAMSRATIGGVSPDRAAPVAAAVMPEANACLVGAGVRRQPKAPLPPSGPR